MLVHNRQIIALGKVDHDERSLSGKGTPQEPLGVQNYELLTDQQWVKNYVSAVAGDTIPYSGSDSVKVDEHKISVKETWLANQLQSYTYNKQTIDSKDTAVRNQFSAYIPRTASAGWDVKPYTGDNVKVQVDPSTHQITIIGEWYVTPEGLETELLKYYTKSQVDALLANLGGYQVVPLKNGLPDVDEPTNKYIYLTKIDTATGDDKYKEWIWSGAWECIGETSLDLSEYVTETELAEALEPYATKHFVSAGYQEKGNYVSASQLEEYYDKTTIDQKIEDFITSAEADTRYATKQELTDKAEEISAWANGKFITSADVETALETYATKEYVDTASAGVKSWVEEQGYITEDALTDLATKDYVDTASAGVKSWVEDQHYLTEHQSLEEYAKEAWVSANFLSSAASANFAQKTDLDDYVTKAETTEWDITPYSGKDGIKVDVENHEISFSGDFVDEHELEEALQPYVTETDLENELKPYVLTSAVSGFHNTVLSADETVDLTEERLQDGTYQYKLHVEPGDITKISADKGLSAEKVDDTWVIGVENPQVSFGRFYQTTEQSEEYYAKAELYGDTIEYDEDEHEIYLNAGFFHIDAQVDIVVPGDLEGDAIGVYSVQVAPMLGSSTMTRPIIKRDIENSYEHTETLELSFDVKINGRTKFAIDVSGLPANVHTTYAIQNINIHEQITTVSELQGGGGTYAEGKGITINASNEINVNAGAGLKIDQNTNTVMVNVKAGSGLKIEDSGQLAGSVVLDDVTEEVVETVQHIAEDLETKVTVNFDYANITGTTDFGTIGSTTGNGVLLGFLFAVPINSKIYAEGETDAAYVTNIGVFSLQSYTQRPLVLGLFEYDPNYIDTSENPPQRGRTTALCDTGPVTLVAGLNEFPIKNIGTEHIESGVNTAALKAGCLYYAAIYISKDGGNQIALASCPGYNATFNTKPTITCDACNINIDTSLNPEKANFNDINFKSGTTTNYHELPSAPRLFMQVRNAKKNLS